RPGDRRASLSLVRPPGARDADRHGTRARRRRQRPRGGTLRARPPGGAPPVLHRHRRRIRRIHPGKAARSRGAVERPHRRTCVATAHLKGGSPMSPALEVALLWLLFAGTHIGLASRPIRTPLARALGEIGFAGVFSVIATVGFAVLVHFYATHRFEGAAGPALGGIPAVRWVLMGVIVVGVALATAGAFVFPSAPMALFHRYP